MEIVSPRNVRNLALTIADATWHYRKHGTFRPKLLQLVKSNPKELVEATTRKACANEEKDALVALKTLTALKGIGPATASLLLSVHRIEEVPFFSDVCLRYDYADSSISFRSPNFRRPPTLISVF